MWDSVFTFVDMDDAPVVLEKGLPAIGAALLAGAAGFASTGAPQNIASTLTGGSAEKSVPAGPRKDKSLEERRVKQTKRRGVSVSEAGRTLGKSETMREAWDLIKSIEKESEESLDKSIRVLSEAELLLQQLEGMLQRRG